MSFGEIFDLTAGVYFVFLLYIVNRKCVDRGSRMKPLLALGRRNRHGESCYSVAARHIIFLSFLTRGELCTPRLKTGVL